MKIRQGFVSNSSSSSFIVIGKKPNYHCSKLTKEQAERIIKYIENSENKPNINWSGEDVYLTPFICDGIDDYYDIKHSNNTYLYCYGGHGLPYSESDYSEIDDNIWILNRHYFGTEFIAGLAVIPERKRKEFPYNSFKYEYNFPNYVPNNIIEYVGINNSKLEINIGGQKISIIVNDGDYIAYLFSNEISAENMKIYKKIQKYGKVMKGELI